MANTEASNSSAQIVAAPGAPRLGPTVDFATLLGICGAFAMIVGAMVLGGQPKAFLDIPVQVSAVLGKANMQVSQLLKLGRGAVVELDRKVGEAIDIYVNNRLVARGEVVVVEDRLGVTMTEIIKMEHS